ncbi:MAG: histidine phosphatase family protein [Acidimicrobiales bacterium]
MRHGRTTANASGLLLGRADPELDDVGREQAACIGAALPAGITVYSSPLTRTRQTAAAIADDVTIDERLIELDYGDFDLRPLAEITPETWAAWRADPNFRPPNGETLVELATRVGELLDELAPLAAQRDVAVVTHVSPIKAAMAWALGVGIEVSWRSMVAQASISRIEVSSRGPSLHAFNDTHHLE